MKNKLNNTLADLPNQLGTDNSIESMHRYQTPATLENWMALNYPDEKYEDLPAEL